MSVLGPIACYTSGDIVCNTIRSSRTWETDVIEKLRPYMTPATTFVDVGSNVGWYAFTMARTHRVVAFEPFHKNIALQNATRCMHPRRADRIRLHPFGLSNRTEVCSLFQIPTVNHGDTHTACTTASRDAFASAKYEELGRSVVRRLDDVATDDLVRAEKVMKIDIEGHEYEMLLGATRFFSSAHAPRAIYMEVFQLGGRKEDAVRLLQERGYRLVTANPDAPNYLFVRS